MQFDVDGLLENLAERIASKLEQKINPKNGARLLSVPAAAEYLGRSEQAVYLMITHKKLPVVRSDRRVMIDVRDLDQLVEDNKR